MKNNLNFNFKKGELKSHTKKIQSLNAVKRLQINASAPLSNSSKEV